MAQKSRRKMPHTAPKRERAKDKPNGGLMHHGGALVETFRMSGGTVLAMIPGDPDLPPGLQLSQAVVQLALIGAPAFMLDGGEKHYVTYLTPEAAISTGQGLVEAGTEASAAPELEESSSGLVLARRGDDIQRAVAEAAQTERLRSG